MKTFKQFQEGLANDDIHFDASPAKIKALAKNSPQGTARFSIEHDGSIHAADAYNFTHEEISPDEKQIHTRGWVQHDGAGNYEMMTDPHNAQHKHLDRLRKAGVKDGNFDIPKRWHDDD